MALTTQVNGTTNGGNPNQARASWWNDYKDALTGVMTDQAFAMNYRPGSGTTATLTLKGDGFGPLIRGYDTDNTTVRYTLDHSGNETISGLLTASGGLNGKYGTIRNGTTTYVNTYTGTSNPTGDGVNTPATGAIWIKA